MRASMAYFAGVGTVVAAATVGLGGGVLISNIVSPHAPKTEMSKLELRMSEKPIPATNVSSEPAAHVASTQAKPAEAQVADRAPASAAPAEPSPPPAAAPVTQAATSEQARAPEAAFAKANDADVKARDVDARRDARRAAEEKRKAERRQQWTERRRHLQRQDLELRDVEARIRQETEPTEPGGSFASERVRLDMPRIQLFEAE